MKKEALEVDAWLKDVAPSTALRKWFGHREGRWEEFQRRYRRELRERREALSPLIEANKRGTVTLVYSAHDLEHNGAVVLRDYLAKQTRGRTSKPRARRSPQRSRTPATHGSNYRAAHRQGEAYAPHRRS